MCAAGKLEAEPRGNQSELLRPPLLCRSHRGLRCVLHELIPPKLDCLCLTNQALVNYHGMIVSSLANKIMALCYSNGRDV